MENESDLEMLEKGDLVKLLKGIKQQKSETEEKMKKMEASIKELEKLAKKSGPTLDARSMFPLEEISKWLDMAPDFLEKQMTDRPSQLLAMVYYKFNQEQAEYDMEMNTIGINEYEGSSVASVFGEMGKFLNTNMERPENMSVSEFKKVALSYLKTYENLPKWIKVEERRMNSCMSFTGILLHLYYRHEDKVFGDNKVFDKMAEKVEIQPLVEQKKVESVKVEPIIVTQTPVETAELPEPEEPDVEEPVEEPKKPKRRG